MLFVRCAAVAAVLLSAVGASAGPRSTVSFSNVDSIGAAGAAGNQVRTVTLSGGWEIKRIDFSGTLQTVIPNTEASEAQVRVTPPAGMGPVFNVPIIWDTTLQPAGVVLTGSISLGEPVAGWHASGTWTFEFYETFDDGAGADARWKTVNFTFNDAPWPPNLLPVADDLGIISTGQRIVHPTLQANTVKWYRFHLADSIGAVGQTNGLAIDTSAGPLSGVTDTVLALYNSQGQRIAFNDDVTISNRMSVLSFGTVVPAGSPVPDTLVGAAGSLDPGTYYLAVAAYNSTNTYADDFGVTSGATAAGPIQVALRASVPGPGGACPADFNRSGGIEIQDIFDFLSAWFAGCP